MSFCVILGAFGLVLVFFDVFLIIFWLVLRSVFGSVFESVFESVWFCFGYVPNYSNWKKDDLAHKTKNSAFNYGFGA